MPLPSTALRLQVSYTLNTTGIKMAGMTPKDAARCSSCHSHDISKFRGLLDPRNTVLVPADCCLQSLQCTALDRTTHPCCPSSCITYICCLRQQMLGRVHQRARGCTWQAAPLAAKSMRNRKPSSQDRQNSLSGSATCLIMVSLHHQSRHCLSTDPTPRQICTCLVRLENPRWTSQVTRGGC